MGNETHKPLRMFDGISTRLACTCGWSSHWRVEKESAELEWGEHAVKTIQRNINRRSFVIPNNPLGGLN